MYSVLLLEFLLAQELWRQSGLLSYKGTEVRLVGKTEYRRYLLDAEVMVLQHHVGLGHYLLVDYLACRFSGYLFADGIEVFRGNVEFVGIELHRSALGMLMQDADELSEKNFR